MKTRLPLVQTLRSLPSEWRHDPLPEIRDAIAETGEKLAVLDDDPIGAQTTRGVAVLMDCSVDAIARELESDLPAFFLVTNSRGMPLSDAKRVIGEVGRNLREAAMRSGRSVAVISRCDSTLRGHYPGEIEALDEALGGGFDARILMPCLTEGGRYTIDDVHYVSDGEWMVPTGETEFARDPVFGYRSSNLRDWLEEKTGGDVPSDKVMSVSLTDIRSGGPPRVAEIVSDLEGGQTCIVNGVSPRDVDVVARGFMAAEKRGKRFLYSTAASMIRARVGQSAGEPLTRDDLSLPDTGGALILVGSHVPRTNAQLSKLLEVPGVQGVEVDAEALVYGDAPSEAVRVAAVVNEHLSMNRDVVAYTSRHPVEAIDSQAKLDIGMRVSEGLVDVARGVAVTPRYVVTKGGMTTSTVSAGALGVQRAVAIGQVTPGVPTWELGPEARFPGLILVAFPGNVGDEWTLVETVNQLANPA